MVYRISTAGCNLSVVSELEGTLLKDSDTFPYFLLLAFEASGWLRFALLLLAWPLYASLGALGLDEPALRLAAFVSTAGLRRCDIELADRAVLPKFVLDDLNPDAWRTFAAFGRKTVATRCPTLMVEWLAHKHLGAHEVVGTELEFNRFGRATGLVRLCSPRQGPDQMKGTLRTGWPDVGLGRPGSKLLPPCKEKWLAPFPVDDRTLLDQLSHPPPVIFHDGRLVPRPTTATALVILLWLPFGGVFAVVRIVVRVLLPMWLIPYAIPVFGGELKIQGDSPPAVTSFENSRGATAPRRPKVHSLLLMDPLALYVALQRKVTAVTYSISRLSEILSPIPTVRLSRDRRVDAEKIRAELEKGDLVVCPEGTTCREPFLLRFSALFAELTDQIVPVGINYRVGFFHATTASGYKAMDPIYFMMNPRPAYEVTFLSQLPLELTCSGGKSSHEVANYVQQVLGAAMGYECTKLTRRDKYQVLAGNDGSVPYISYPGTLRKTIQHFMQKHFQQFVFRSKGFFP